MKLFLSSAASVLALTLAGCGDSVDSSSENVDKMVEAASPNSQPTVQDAKEFLEGKVADGIISENCSKRIIKLIDSLTTRR